MMLRRLFAGALILGLLAAPVTARAEEESAVAQALTDACVYGTEADLTEMNILLEDMEAVFYDLYDEGKLPWYSERSYSGHYNKENNLVLDFQPSLLDPEQYDRTRYEQAIAAALAQCALPGMTPVQLALSVHDWLIVNCIYDESLEKNTGYDLLINGTTVCAGYASAYRDMLTRLGIPCRIVTSEGMNHGWNLVQLDGQWYHVDVTWDDPTPDSYGQVLHDFFLLTDEEVAAGDEPHYGWETDITCTDTRFSDAWWRDTVGQICYADSKTAYLIRTKDWNNYLYARDEASGEETRLYRDKKSYVNLGEGEYCYSHGSLSLWNGRLYYSTQDELISMELSGKDQRREYRHNTRTEHTYLFACHVDRDTMYATFCDHDGNKSAAILALDPTGYHTHSFTETVEPPACLEPGQTLSVCECGLSAMSLPTAPTGHSFTIVEKRDASIFSAGWATLECSACGEESREDYPQIPFVDWLGDNSAFVAVAAALLFSLLKLLKKKPRST